MLFFGQKCKASETLEIHFSSPHSTCLLRRGARKRRRRQTLGTLRSDNGDVHENVAIIPIRPGTEKKGILAGAEQRETRSSSDRDGRIYRLAVPVPK